MTLVAAGDEDQGARAEKSASAFRTISEVSETVDVPQHVLRFWETKFPQIRPLKRGGGRRYYRPEDVDLLRRIRSLLYSEGYTIKGVQRLLRNGRGAKPRPGGEAGAGAAAPVPAPTLAADIGAGAPAMRSALDAGPGGGTDDDEIGHDEIGHDANGGDESSGDAVRLAEVEAAVRQEFSEIRAEVVALREMLRRRLG